jgi:hypothetical protein
MQTGVILQTSYHESFCAVDSNRVRDREIEIDIYEMFLLYDLVCILLFSREGERNES